MAVFVELTLIIVVLCSTFFCSSLAASTQSIISTTTVSTIETTTSTPTSTTTLTTTSTLTTTTILSTTPTVPTTTPTTSTTTPTASTTTATSSRTTATRSTTSSTTTPTLGPTTKITTASTTTLSTAESYLGVGVGVGVGGFFLLATLIMLLAYFFCKPCKKRRNADIEETKLQTMMEEEVIREMPPRETNNIPVSELLMLLWERRKNKPKYQEEFKSLPPSSRPRLKSCSEASMYPSKNRYTDILPYNEDRVRLQTCSEDYINASFVDGYEKENEFIATQGPLRDTCENFWSMVWEQKSDKLIMLTNVLEDGMPKCAAYFPCRQLEGISGKVMTFKNFSVSVVREEAFDEYVHREFNVQKGNEKRRVYQFHFTDWPDKGVPETCTSLLRFRKACMASNNPHERPVIIHCSAGVGRTGTLLAIDILLRQAERSGVVDVAMCVDKMRRKRMSMVQTLSQYIFTHHAVAEGLMLGDVSMAPEIFMNLYANLDKPHMHGKSYLDLQFELLEASKPYFSEYSFSNGMNHRDQNRFSKILPMDDFMPSFNSPYDQYINAVHVSGFKGNRDTIVTQSPMPGDFETFWKMVKEHRCTVVVMLNDLLENEPKYWPDDGQAEVYGRMAVMNAGEISSDDIVASDFRVSGLKSDDSTSREESSGELNDGYSSDLSDDSVKQRLSKDPASLHVRHFRLGGWDEKHYPKDKIGSLLSLMTEVRRCLQRVPEGSLLIHCLNGADKSGLFIALLNVLLKMERVGEVDVHNAVKVVQKRRTEFISSKEQLKYLYDIVCHYLFSLRPS